MGWLRDLMSGSESSVRSYGELARGVLASTAWDDSPRPQARSLAALFSKLDRGLELEWLADRSPVQLALAEVLKCPVTEVRAALETELPERQQAQGRLRLDDLRFGRTVALEVEPPCPGIPAGVLDPSTWEKLWWVAPAGAGKSFAGRWLEARGLATYLAATSWPEAVGSMRARRPVLVELVGAVSEPHPTIGFPPVCVASPSEPEDATGWTVIHSSPVSTFLDDLIDWVGERLPDDGHFDTERARHWFREGPLDSGLVDSLGTALGLCGVLDEEGFGAAHRSGLRELATRVFSRRVSNLAGRDSPDAPWLRRNGFEVLVGLGRRLLTDTTDVWSAPRSLDGWLALVPPEYQRDVDIDWLRATLSDGIGALREVDVRRATRRLPPGAYRIVRALRSVGVLAEVGPDSLAFRPLWMARVALEEAKHQLVNGSPFEYGEALLAPQAAEGIARALLVRIRQDETSPIEAVTELEADSNPAHVAALEAVARVTGLSLLAGHEVPGEALEVLWQEQSRLALRFGDEPPRPRIAHRAPVGSTLHDTVWRLALLAITEQVDAPGTDPWLAPWKLSSPPEELVRLLNQVAAELPSFPAALAHDTYALVDRLRQALGDLNDPPHLLELPAALLDGLELGVLTWDLVTELQSVPHGVGAVQQIAGRRGRSWAETATALWKVWAESDEPASAIPWLAAEAEGADLFWRHLPLEILKGNALERLDVIAAHELSDEQLETLLGRYETLTPRARPELWRTLPAAWATRALARVRHFEPASGRVIWSRFGAEMPERLATLARSSSINALLATAPPGATSAVVRRLSTVSRDDLSDEALDALRRWLATRVAQRVPGFAEAYGLLAEIENEISHASGS